MTQNGAFFHPQDVAWISASLRFLEGIMPVAHLAPEHPGLVGLFTPHMEWALIDHTFSSVELAHLTAALTYYHGFASARGNTVRSVYGQDITVQVQRGVRDLLMRLMTAAGVYEHGFLERTLAQGRAYAEAYLAAAVQMQRDQAVRA